MNDNYDYDDVELKISILCKKFDNLQPWHEDLAQELRVHAYYYSNNYYDLYRKAIDFWRQVQTKQRPEVPYFDLEVLQPASSEIESNYDFEHLVDLISLELERPGYNKWDNDMLELAKRLLKIILEDIDPKYEKSDIENKSTLNHYINHRLNLSWVSEETGIGYKRVVAAMKFLEDTVRGLAAMNKIDIPSEYFKGYYEDEGK